MARKRFQTRPESLSTTEKKKRGEDRQGELSQKAKKLVPKGKKSSTVTGGEFSARLRRHITNKIKTNKEGGKKKKERRRNVGSSEFLKKNQPDETENQRVKKELSLTRPLANKEGRAETTVREEKDCSGVLNNFSRSGREGLKGPGEKKRKTVTRGDQHYRVRGIRGYKTGVTQGNKEKNVKRGTTLGGLHPTQALVGQNTKKRIGWCSGEGQGKAELKKGWSRVKEKK